MLIIDELADSKLLKALEGIRNKTGPEASRCLHFKLAGRTLAAQDIHRVIISAITRHLQAAHPEIFMCDDGDVYVLTGSVPSRHMHFAMLEVAEFLHIPADDSLAVLHDLDVMIHHLLLDLEQKQAQRREAIAALQKRHDEAQLRRRREAILDSNIQPVLQNIAARRNARTNAELMVIEDDIFSRRLVENVLKKQYSLTALGDAELAIATYVNLAPDVLFLDINLPDVSGHELLQKLIALDPHAYIVMLSGNADQANIVQAMKAGAKGFIAKPFTREKLIQYIDRCPTITQHLVTLH